MGTCGGGLSAVDEETLRKAKEHSNQLEKAISADINADRQVCKLLLLGAGESGKSTLFKQMITIYGKGFTEKERLAYIPIISSNVISSIKTLCKHSEIFGPVSKQNVPSRHMIETELKGDEVIDMTLAQHIDALWHDAGIQATYAKRAKYQLTDSASYFLDMIKTIAQPNYVPSQQDVLRSRVRTTGIVENDFDIESNRFKMFDVGGQRNERKKWIHCFENVTAILFVAAISEYDQVLYEDENTNRMHEAVTLFDDICNSQWFVNTSIILFLNKRDLFADKIIKVPLTVCFPEYDGKNTYEEAAEYIRTVFETKNRSKEKLIYSHITCATDTDNVAAVFNAVKDIIIRQSLNQAGLL